MYLMIISLFGNDIREAEKDPMLEKPNNVIVVITTNGMATDVVEKIISNIKGYELGLEIFVIKEHRDTFSYSCREITVPKDYVCPNGSRNKMRAMQYGNEWLRTEGYGRETYICHLDDDSMVDKPYLEYVINHMTVEGGQGCIRLREFGRHLFSSLSDIVRIANCEAWCRHYNKGNRPQFVHGEGIVVRADVEQEIGWDYGTYGAEDLIMGLEISKKYTFCHIPAGNIYIAPPHHGQGFLQTEAQVVLVHIQERREGSEAEPAHLSLLYLHVHGGRDRADRPGIALDLYLDGYLHHTSDPARNHPEHNWIHQLLSVRGAL
ncbi:hypothetical protein AOA81_00020 [Methanomassiliicoccales archaeon RumEn M2]|nr:hypothetical protein AOA81_00020 [Methanomassiliicoccales archaeon RumEn M2]